MSSAMKGGAQSGAAWLSLLHGETPSLETRSLSDFDRPNGPTRVGLTERFGRAFLPLLNCSWHVSACLDPIDLRSGNS